MSNPFIKFVGDPIHTEMQPIRIGTDCSGIEAPIQALEKLGIPYIHEWSSEVDKYCIESIKANYYPKRLYGDDNGNYKDGDIRNRDHNTLPDIDLYVCGFPCQPFSHAGKRKGLEDERGNIFFTCVETIRKKKPKHFILENVRGLIHHNKGQTWKIIWKEIFSLTELGYNVYWKLLNTRNYGIPQNRERVYIVGSMEKFEWPIETKMDDINDYIDNSDTTRREPPPYIQKCGLLDKVPDNSVFVDFGFRYFAHSNADKYSPCLTASHSKDFWCIKHSRYITVKEALNLQGFEGLNQVVSDSRLKKQIGNSMSINVITALLKQLLL